MAPCIVPANTQSAILESLKHRNIVQLVQKIRDEKNEHIFIVMEVSTHRRAMLLSR